MWTPLVRFRQLPIQPAHYTFLERHPEVTKNHVLAILCFVHTPEPNTHFFRLQLMDDKFYQLKYNLWAKLFAKQTCKWVSFQWSTKKEKKLPWTKLLHRCVSKFYSQDGGNRQTPYQLNNFSYTDFSYVLKVGLTSFINKDSATFRLKVLFV